MMSRLPPADQTGPQGPLDGYRIVEFAANLAAPVASMLLADQGADVVKVESGAGDQMRYTGARRTSVPDLATLFLNANRNKRSVVLNLKSDEGVSRAKALIASADVVIQNFRPGVMERLGLGYEDARKLRPEIVYLSVSGVGTTGPDVERKVYDPVIQAMSGIGFILQDAAGEPHLIGSPVVDILTAYTAWQAVTAALLHRERTGNGQHVQVSMLKAALSFFWVSGMSSHTLVGDDVINKRPRARTKTLYRTSDDHIMVASLSNDEFAALARALERPDLSTEPRFASLNDRIQNCEALAEEIGAELEKRPTAHWLERLRAEDAIFSRVNPLEALHLDPQIAAIGAITEREHPHAGRYRQASHPVDFGSGTPGLRWHAPALGEQTEAILAELGEAAKDHAGRSDKVG